MSSPETKESSLAQLLRNRSAENINQNVNISSRTRRASCGGNLAMRQRRSSVDQNMARRRDVISQGSPASLQRRDSLEMIPTASPRGERVQEKATLDHKLKTKKEVHSCATSRSLLQLYLQSPVLSLKLKPWHAAVTDDTLKDVCKRFPHVRKIDLSKCSRVNESALKDLLKSCKQLRVVKMNKCLQLSDRFLDAVLQYGQKVQKLQIRGCNGISTLQVKKFVSSSLSLRKFVSPQGETLAEIIFGKDEEDKTLLHTLARSGDLHCAKNLVHKGAVLTVADKQKMNPIHEAVLSGNVELVSFFLNTLSCEGERDNIGKEKREAKTSKESNQKKESKRVVHQPPGGNGNGRPSEGDQKNEEEDDDEDWDEEEEEEEDLSSSDSAAGTSPQELGRGSSEQTLPQQPASSVPITLQKNKAEDPVSPPLSTSPSSLPSSAVTHSTSSASIAPPPFQTSADNLHLSGTMDGMVSRRPSEALLQQRNKHGKGLLHLASESGHLEIVKLLVSSGADVTAVDSFGQTPFLLSAARGKDQIVAYYIRLQQEAQMDCAIFKLEPVVEKARSTSLPPSLRQTQSEEELGNKEALNSARRVVKKEQTDADGLSAMHLAAAGGHKNVVMLLFRHSVGGDIHDVDVDGWTPLHYACQKGNTELVRLLIEHGADVNFASDYDATTPLHVAAFHGHSEAVGELLSRGAEVNCQKRNFLNALHLAAMAGHVSVVDRLVKGGIETKTSNAYGMNALHMAAHAGNTEVVDYLVGQGLLSVNCKDDAGNTPLILASKSGHSQLISLLLLKYRADTEAKDAQGLSCLHVACNAGHPESVQVLIQEGGMSVNQKSGQCSSPLHYAISKEIALRLIKEGADLNFKDSEQWTPLHCASYKGNGEVVEVLAGAGADLNCKNRFGSTPLMLAAERGFAEIVELLCNKGADFEIKNLYGRTALLSAAQSGHAGVVEVLVSKGANIRVKNKTGSSALHMACKEGHENVAKILVLKGMNSNESDAFGKSSVDIAREGGFTRLTEQLIGSFSTVKFSMNPRMTRSNSLPGYV